MPEGDRSFWHDVHHSLALIAVLAAAVDVEESLSVRSRRRLRLMRHEVRCIEELARSMAPAGTRLPNAGVSLHTVLREAVELLDEVYPADLCLDDEPVDVALDAPGARRLVMNLLENALVAVGVGGKVAVAVRRDGGDAVLLVADSGPGFGPTGAPVDGCGLATVRAIVARGGGTLTFGSSPLGGAEVTVRLPVR